MAGFEDDFARGEREAARLVAAMERALQRAEQFEKQAERDSSLRRREAQNVKQEVARDRVRGETIGQQPASRVQKRLQDEEAINRKLKERETLQRRESAQLQAQNSAVQRRALLPGGAGGGGRIPPPPLPPTAQLPPPGGDDPYGRRALPPGRQPLGLPRPGETVGGSQYYQQEARASDQARRASESYTGAKQQEARANTSAGRSMNENLGVLGQTNTAYQRYGALSAEWIGATQRGSTTIQELGRQTATTIGKFGGWLAAGSLLFTALGAIRAVGQGAIDSSSGVNQLQRVINGVDPDQATRGFRALADSFNLPVGVASDAVYQMGKVFHDTNQAMEASRAVLFSVKVGELDVATASRYLIAIINGFDLPANKMVDVFDQINQAQNKFGISISDVEAGLAKASGTFRAAGGDFSHLLAIITTAQKVTGVTGEVVGTAIARAPNFLRKPQNVEILRSFGINAHDDIDKVIEQAFQKAQGLSGERLQVLAGAIFGPQYGARIGTPLLQHLDKYQEVLQKTSPDQSHNSAQRELNRLLGSMQERLVKIVNQLQIMGSGLASAGFLDVFGAALTLLGHVLQQANDLIEVFDRIPAPLRHSLAVLIEIAAVIKLMRRFNLGESFAQGSAGAAVFTRPNQQAHLLGESYTGQQQFLATEADRASTAAARAGIEVQVAKERLAAEEAAAMQRTNATTSAAVAEEANVVRARNQLNVAMEGQLAAENRGLTILAQQAQVEQKQALLAAEKTNARAATLAATYGDVIPPRAGAPLRASERLAAQGYAIDAEGNIVRAEAAAAASAAGVGAESARAAKAAEGVGAASRAGLAATTVATSRTAAVRTSLRSYGAGMMTWGRNLGRLGGEMLSFIGGPMGILLGGLLFYPQISDAFSGLWNRYSNAQAEADAAAKQAGGTLEQMRDIGKAGEKSMAQLRSQAGDTRDYGRGHGLDELLDYATSDPLKIIGLTPDTHQQDAQNAILARMNLHLVNIVKGDVADIENYQKGSKQWRAQVRTARDEVANLDGIVSPQIVKALNAQIDKLAPRAEAYTSGVLSAFEKLSTLTNKSLGDRLTNIADLIGAGGAKPADFSQFARTTQETIFRGNQPGATLKERADAATAMQDYASTLNSAAEDEKNLTLTLARTQGQRNRAFGSYIQSVQSGGRDIRRTFRRQRQGLQQQLSKVTGDLRELQQDKAVIPNPDATRGPNPTVQNPEIAKLKKRADEIRKSMKGLDASQKQQMRQIRALIVEQRQALIDERVGVIGELGEIASARVGPDDPVQQARIGLRAAQHALRVVREGGGSPAQKRQALLEMLNARNELQDAIKSEAQTMLDASQALAQARAHGDPVLEARADIAHANGMLRIASNPAERKQAMAELIQSRDAMDQAIADIATARIDLAIARTDDPVKEANLRVRQAEIQLQHANGALERLQAQASKAQAVRDRRDAIAQARIDNIEFQADIDKISTDQEINALERLLKTVNLSRDMRRDLRRKIHDLKQQTDQEASGFELKVGDIQLPTIYDIRRAVQGGLGGGASQRVYADNSTTQINVTNNGDTAAFGREMDNALRRNGRSAQISAGLTS